MEKAEYVQEEAQRGGGDIKTSFGLGGTLSNLLTLFGVNVHTNLEAEYHLESEKRKLCRKFSNISKVDFLVMINEMIGQYSKENNGKKAHSMRGLAHVEFCLGQLQSAERKYQKVIDAFRKERASYDHTRSKIYLAECLMEEDQFQEAGRLLEEASQGLEGEHESPIISRLQGRLEMYGCDYEKASTLLTGALCYFKRKDNKVNILPCLMDMGRLRYYQDDFSGSFFFLQEALRLTETSENIPVRMRVFLLLEETCKKMGEREKSVKYKTQAQRIQNHLLRLQKLYQ